MHRRAARRPRRSSDPALNRRSGAVTVTGSSRSRPSFTDSAAFIAPALGAAGMHAGQGERDIGVRRADHPERQFAGRGSAARFERGSRAATHPRRRHPAEFRPALSPPRRGAGGASMSRSSAATQPAHRRSIRGGPDDRQFARQIPGVRRQRERHRTRSVGQMGLKRHARAAPAARSPAPRTDWARSAPRPARSPRTAAAPRSVPLHAAPRRGRVPGQIQTRPDRSGRWSARRGPQAAGDAQSRRHPGSTARTPATASCLVRLQRDVIQPDATARIRTGRSTPRLAASDVRAGPNRRCRPPAARTVRPFRDLSGSRGNNAANSPGSGTLPSIENV